MKTTFGCFAKNWQRLVLSAALLALPLAVGVTGCCSSSRYYDSKGEYVNDKEISSHVRHALRHDPEYKFPDINVTTYKGVVQLSGFANTSAQKSRAGDVAKSVAGVKEVENNITVKQ